MQRRGFITMVGGAVLATSGCLGFGGGGSRSQEQLVFDGQDGPAVGQSVAIDGTTVLTGKNQSGASYVVAEHADGSWEDTARFTQDIGQGPARVGLSGDIGVLAGGGAATIIERTTDGWEQTTTLRSEGDGSQPRYAAGIADGTVAVTGGSGVALFEKQDGSWTQQTTLQVGSWSVAASGSTIVVGNSNATVDGVSNAGRVRVFEKSDDTWSQTAAVTASEISADLRLGQSVGVAGDTVVAGALPDASADAESAGAVYVFVDDGDEWTRQSVIDPPEISYRGRFGSAVATTGDQLLVGATGLSRGYLYTDSDGSWDQTDAFAPDDTDRDSVFGQSVGLTSDWAVIGDEFALSEDTFQNGAAYLFPV